MVRLLVSSSWGDVSAERKGRGRQALRFGDMLLFCESGGMISFKGKQGKPGWPRGQQHDAEVHVRLPREVLKVLKKRSGQWHANVSQIVRAMIAAGMLDLAGRAAKVIRDDQAAAWRLRAISRRRRLD